MSNIVINTESIDEFIEKKKAKILKIEAYVREKVVFINSQSDNFEKFLKPFGSGLEMSNLCCLDDNYNAASRLHVHCTFTLSKEYKNIKLLYHKLQSAFNTDCNFIGIRAEFEPHRIIGTRVDFKIYL